VPIERLVDLVNVTVTAPAGCGKTELIKDWLSNYDSAKPVLILTHTNAGVTALRQRLERARISWSSYRLSTIDGWAIRLVSMFPARSGLPSEAVKSKIDYPEVRNATMRLLEGRHIDELLRSSYHRIVVDEYQDCSVAQHKLICQAAEVVPAVLLGDPMQAIFGWRGNEPPDWTSDVCSRFPVILKASGPDSRGIPLKLEF
jgi:DNA helicase-2/ATP-dependent DNA helicase PcrA